MSMKGLWTSKTNIMLILTLLLLVGVAPAVFGVADEAVRRSLFLRTEEIVGLVNVLQASPSGTSHVFLFPKGECELTVNRLNVNLTFGKLSSIKEIISHVEVVDNSIKCHKTEDKRLYLKRCGDRIFVDEKIRECR